MFSMDFQVTQQNASLVEEAVAAPISWPVRRIISPGWSRYLMSKSTLKQ